MDASELGFKIGETPFDNISNISFGDDGLSIGGVVGFAFINGLYFNLGCSLDYFTFGCYSFFVVIIFFSMQEFMVVLFVEIEFFNGH